MIGGRWSVVVGCGELEGRFLWEDGVVGCCFLGEDDGGGR